MGAKEVSAAARRMPDSLRGPADEPEYVALLDMHLAGLDDVDADQSRPDPLDVEPAQGDDGAGSVDVDAIGAGGQDPRQRMRTVDGNRLGDGDRAEAARIQTIDDAAGGGLRDRARERLARCRAAARIGVVAYARHPGARRLGVCRTGVQHWKAYAADSGKQQWGFHDLPSSLSVRTVPAQPSRPRSRRLD